MTARRPDHRSTFVSVLRPVLISPSATEGKHEVERMAPRRRPHNLLERVPHDHVDERPWSWRFLQVFVTLEQIVNFLGLRSLRKFSCDQANTCRVQKTTKFLLATDVLIVYKRQGSFGDATYRVQKTKFLLAMDVSSCAKDRFLLAMLKRNPMKDSSVPAPFNTSHSSETCERLWS